MRHYLFMIACILLISLIVIFCPSRYANSYNVPQHSLKTGINVDTHILKSDNNSLVNKVRVYNTKNLDLSIIKGDDFAKEHHFKLDKQFYNSKLKEFSITILAK